MDLRDYLRMLARNWLLILLLLVVGVGAGGAYALVQKPVYEATATAFVSASAGDSLSELSAGAGYLELAVKGYASISTTAYVLRPVIAHEGLDISPADLAAQVTAVAGDQEAVLQITVKDSSPARAAQIANAITSQLAVAVVDLTPNGSTTGTSSAVKLTPVDPAIPPTSTAGLKPWLIVALGGAAGLVVAVLIGLLRELLDTRIRSREDLARVTDAPFLGATARNAGGRSRRLIVRDAAESPGAEEYRTIRTNLRFVQLDQSRRSVVVTSANEREGKSTAAANLALAVGGLGDRVLLIDADLRRPILATIFGLDGGVGLSDVVIGDVQIEDAVQHIAAGGIDLLPAGSIPPNPNELLQSHGIDELLGRLHEQYDLIVIDSPPLLAVSDAVVLSSRVGGALVIAAAGRARRGQLDQALESLARAEARVLGVVLTMLPRRSGTPYGYGVGAANASNAKRNSRKSAARRALAAEHGA